MSRSSSAMSGILFQPSEPRSKVTMVWATSPFSETAGKPTCSAVAGLITDGARPSLASATPSIAANSAACSSMAARSSSVRPPSRS